MAGKHEDSSRKQDGGADKPFGTQLKSIGGKHVHDPRSQRFIPLLADAKVDPEAGAGSV